MPSGSLLLLPNGFYFFGGLGLGGGDDGRGVGLSFNCLPGGGGGGDDGFLAIINYFKISNIPVSPIKIIEKRINNFALYNIFNLLSLTF